MAAEARVTREYPEDPRCPECGGPVGATATYCMHCAADIDAALPRDTDESSDSESSTAAVARATNGVLAPEGLLDDALTSVVGVLGGGVVGVVGTVVLLVLTDSSWGVGVGLLAWLAATAHLVKQPTALEAAARTADGIALVLLLVPLVAFGPSSSGTTLATRLVVFVSMLGAAVIPAGLAAGVGVLLRRAGADHPPGD